MNSGLLALVTLAAVWNPVSLMVPRNGDVHIPARIEVPHDAEAPVEGMLVSINGDDARYVITQTSAESPRERFLILPGRDENKSLSVNRSTWFSLDDESSEGRLWVKQGGQPVLSYVYGQQLLDGIPENRRRSSYIYPILGLDGNDLTDDFPDDHPHHRGAFWAWPQIRYQDELYDMWHLNGIWVRFDEFLYQETGPVCARLGIRNGWYVGDERVADETVEITVWRSSGPGRAIDISLTWHATGEPLTILGEPNKGYGGFNLRFAPREDTRVTSARGPHEEDSLHARFEWADLSARFRGNDSMQGISVFVHPDNLDAPHAWILRHYGFIGANWPNMGAHELRNEDGPVTFRYRLWVHEGDAYEGRSDAAYRAFRSPVVVQE